MIATTVLDSVAASLGSDEFSTGQFPCLLLTVDMVAVSQASSPESNPDSPAPVTVVAGSCSANELIGAVDFHTMAHLSLPRREAVEALYLRAFTNNALRCRTGPIRLGGCEGTKPKYRSQSVSPPFSVSELCRVLSVPGSDPQQLRTAS